MQKESAYFVVVEILKFQNQRKRFPLSRSGTSPLNDYEGCTGEATQEDTAIHVVPFDCPLEEATIYLFWVVADYDGNGSFFVPLTQS